MAADRTPAGTESFSAHIERVREVMATLDVNDEQAKVEAEIQASKAHWSDLSNAYFTSAEGLATESSSSSQSETASEVEATPKSSVKVAEENVELFRRLQKQYPGGFFWDEDDVGSYRVDKSPSYMIGTDGHPLFVKFELSSEKPFAEGAQAELFHAHGIREDGCKARESGVLKVFKEGTSLKDFLRFLPPTMLKDDSICTHGWFGLQTNCNPIFGVRLLKSSGRFAFSMVRAWGDLRKLIDVRMVYLSNNKGLPFDNNVAIYIMYRVAQGMQSLHERDIIHRDLKASNVLIWSWKGNRPHALDPTSLEPYAFECFVADYECSVGVIGTRFWRAPEILLGLKNRNIFQNPKVFSKQSDVYSFGMTCYEILSGGIPLEELLANDYDGVIGGKRPTLPNPTTTPWMMDLVHRCWHKDLLRRPSFEEIVKILKPQASSTYLAMKKMK